MNNNETSTDTLPDTDRTGALDDLSPPTKLEKFEVKKPKPKPGQPSKFNTRTANENVTVPPGRADPFPGL
jgi:hypothetical protein